MFVVYMLNNIMLSVETEHYLEYAVVDISGGKHQRGCGAVGLDSH